MTLPKAILFDWGETLVHVRFDRNLGVQRLIQSEHNPRGVTAEMVWEVGDELIKATKPIRFEAMGEISRRQFDRNLFERLGITYDMSDDELDNEFCKNYFDPIAVLDALEMLETVKQLGIRTGVVSNSVLGGKAISYVLEQVGLLKHLDFVMSSTDYGFRKPHPQIFTTALAKLGTDPQETWFIGDSISMDIVGAESVGMTAFWYNPSREPTKGVTPKNEISSWKEFIQIIRMNDEN